LRDWKTVFFNPSIPQCTYSYTRRIPVSENAPPSPGTPGEGRGEGSSCGDRQKTLTPTLSRSTGRGRIPTPSPAACISTRRERTPPAPDIPSARLPLPKLCGLSSLCPLPRLPRWVKRLRFPGLTVDKTNNATGAAAGSRSRGTEPPPVAGARASRRAVYARYSPSFP
jgi:hypothetical protein